MAGSSARPCGRLGATTTTAAERPAVAPARLDRPPCDRPCVGLASVVAAVITSARVSDPRVAQQIGGVIIAVTLLQATGTLLVGASGYALLAAILLLISLGGLRLGVRLFEREAILTRWRPSRRRSRPICEADARVLARPRLHARRRPGVYLSGMKPTDRVLDVATAAAKVATVGFGIDALINHASPRLRGKAIRTRAIGYTAALCIVPLAWRLLPGRRGPYPRALDLAVTAPLLADAAGNAFGVYEQARVDDEVHAANAALLAVVAGSLIAPHVNEPWQAALAGGAIAIAGETLWETLEYVAWRLGQRGMDLTYEDTMDDIVGTWIGAVAGAAFVAKRAARRPSARQDRGWRALLGA